VKIAVLGAGGQLGRDIMHVAHVAQIECVGFLHSECDVAIPFKLREALSRFGPGDAVINCAHGLYAMDAEAWPQKCFEAAAFGARNVAIACRNIGARTVYISSDYVFDGTKGLPYEEDDTPNPINAYGMAKRDGEIFTQAMNPNSIVARVSSLFGPQSAKAPHLNFVERMLVKARAGQLVEVVDDIVMSPTYTLDAATTLLSLLSDNAQPGIYHLANEGACSWARFAEAIFERVGTTVPVKRTTSESNATPRRPRYSALGSLKVVRRNWKAALDDYLHRMGALRNDYDWSIFH
jgi:dTDP-4-dehydrorhamnose reductase